MANNARRARMVGSRARSLPNAAGALRKVAAIRPLVPCRRRAVSILQASRASVLGFYRISTMGRGWIVGISGFYPSSLTAISGRPSSSTRARKVAMPIRILLADDHNVVRRGLKVLIEEHRGWEVCAEASSGRQAVELARQIIQLLAEGHRNKNVAHVLGISVKTVETHRAAIMRKIGANSITQIVRYAVRNNLSQA